jgi:hypothetical protein
VTNKIYTHPGQPQMQVEVILASKPSNGAPTIYTIRMRYPRIIHGELMTHRVFSRNARSSRAVPVRTMLLETTTIPFVPWHWGKNQKGMQAGEECNEIISISPSVRDCTREEAWLYARDQANLIATSYMDAGYHKQVVNRLLEPFSWIDTLVTSTDWANFLWLRDHKDAEPHLQDLARLVKQAIEEAEVQDLKEGEWHLPYITERDRTEVEMYHNFDHTEREKWIMETLCKFSAVFCARISYAPFNGDASYAKELERYDNLVKSDRVHASPTEHQAQVDSLAPVFKAGEYVGEDFSYKVLSGNFAPGWIQARKLIPNECHHG